MHVKVKYQVWEKFQPRAKVRQFSRISAWSKGMQAQAYLPQAPDPDQSKDDNRVKSALVAFLSFQNPLS